MNRKPLPIIALAALASAATACASVSTEPDEVAVVYNGALGSATKFSKCVNVSSRDGVNMSDNSWTYPAGQRTFSFNGAGDAEAKPIPVVSKNDVPLTIAGVATFALNTECTTLRQFHERIGRNKKAFVYGTETTANSDTPDYSGWRTMLSVYFGEPLKRALDAAAQEFNGEDLYNDPAIKAKYEARVGELFPDFMKKAGGNYFCNPNFNGQGECGNVVLTLQKPVPPQRFVDAMASREAAKLEKAAQQEINQKVDIEAEAIKRLVDLLGQDGAVAWRQADLAEQQNDLLNKAVEKGQVPVYPVPQNNPLTFPLPSVKQ
ncbi:SPFH domain-containing protein [Nonomuraea turkmeniaca]|uniref:SPFH domain-containing protein n=1 Tax=Nonomuraea turkmeniaca TaxID=103838 RepID=UPI0014772AB2|nr:SPFH domain-containing protein [Nonomuraea turkmeniaca]